MPCLFALFASFLPRGADIFMVKGLQLPGKNSWQADQK